jgi:homoserine O-acetyltransferase/O-succinyltransferase
MALAMPTSQPEPPDGSDRAMLRVLRPVDPDQTMPIGTLPLERGGVLPDVEIRYRTWGTLNETGDNAVLVLHALTGDSNAAGQGGWWEPLIGPGRAIDTDRHFVVSSNIIGGCSGSTGPTSIDPLTGDAYAMRFPIVTIGDMVNAQRRLVERLGISKLVAVGGSIGGYQALEWATRHPDLVSATIAIAAAGRLSPFGIATHSEIGRRAIMADPDWREGDYARFGVSPADGLTIARMAAMLTYQGREIMDLRFGREPAARPSPYPPFGGTYDIEGYLHHQGELLVRRFDANSYLYLTRAMDLYDVGRGQGDAYWLRRIAAPLLLVGIRSDWLYPPEEVRALFAQVEAAGRDATYLELDSPYGHDAFLKEWAALGGMLQEFLDRVRPGEASERGMIAQAY